MKTIVALYDDLEDARSTVEELVEAGIRRDDISFITRDVSGEYAAHVEDYDAEAEAADAAASGAAGGAVVGGLIGVLVGLGALTIPGLGPVIVAGPLAAGLVGVVTGAVTGGLLGALVGWGIPEEEAEYYAEAVRRGSTLVAVSATEPQVDDVVEILNEHDPVDVERRAAYWREEEGWTGWDEEIEPYTADEIASYRDAEEAWDIDWEAEAPAVTAYNFTVMDAEDYANYEPSYRRHYETTYADTDYGFEDYDAAYRYGYTLATSPRFNDYAWDELEPVARERWDEEYGDSAWDEFKEAVRHGWHEAQETVDETF
jgi:uncharacterized membrane protein